MKKLLTMFLALTLVLSMPGTAFAENGSESEVSVQTAGEEESTEPEETTEEEESAEPEQTDAAVDSTVLNLTGDAADEVVNLKDGQSVSTENDVAVRLNVQEDPETEEYTVTMNGEPVEQDHSTSQYHFYYLPAEQVNGEETNVSVSTQSAEETDAQSLDEISTQALEQGIGTEADPYQIATADDLKAFRDKVNGGSTTACAVLTADITLDKNEKWTPIGTSQNKYTGTFDGGDHTISGINVNETGSNEAGLFGDVAQSNTLPVIKNLTIADSSFVTGGYAGAFAGWGGGVYENCHTNADVTVQGKKFAGGIIGDFKGSGITVEISMNQCSNRATVKEVGGFGGYAGGLIGQAEHPLKLEECFNAGTVSSKPGSQTPHAGGLVGATSYAAVISNVYNVGNVTVSSGSNMAGFVGNSSKELTITNAYQHGSVTAGSADGAAAVGVAVGTTTLKNVYKTGSLVDKLNGTGTVTGKATVKTEDELKTLAPTLGGEFANDLAGDAAVNNGFPVLKWQNPTAAAADTLQVKVKGESGTVVLDDEGSTDPTNPTEKTIAFESGSLNTFTADRIYLNVGAENTGTVRLGMELAADGSLSKELTSKKDGYTADELYFYRMPGAVDHTVYAVHTQKETTRYYKLQIQRKAVDVSRYGALSAAWRDDNPVLNTVYDADTGYLKATVNVSNSFARYNKGVLEENNKADSLLTYDKPFKYYGYDISAKAEDGSQTIQFARVGRWWVANKSATDSMNSIPVAAWWGSKNVADQYLAAANALKNESGYADLPDDLKTAFDSAIKAVSDGWTEDTAKPLYLDASDNYTTEKTDFVARDAFGAPMTGEYRLEYQENLMLDYMDVIKTYLKNSDLGSLKYQALKNLTAGVTAKKDKLKVVTAMAVTDDTTKSAYEYYYQRAWRIVNASDISEINTMLNELKLDKVKLEVASSKVQVLVGDTVYDVELTGGGTTFNERKTITVTVPHADEGMKRIYVTRTENDILPSEMSAISGKGYTTNNLFFYDTPAEQTKTVELKHMENSTPYYYTIKVVYKAKSGKALGPNAPMGGAGYSEASPGGLSSYDSNTGYIYGSVKYGPMIYGAMNLYTDGTSNSQNLEPDWKALETSTNKLYYLVNNMQAYFGRPGFYWIPVTDGETSGLLPMRIKISGSDSVEAIVKKATSVQNTEGVSTEAKDMLTAAMQKANSGKYDVGKAMYLKADGSSPDSVTASSDIYARSYFGAQLYGESLIEKDLNTILDLTDIFATWGSNAELAAQQFEAYQKVMDMKGGIHAAMDIQSAKDRDLYQNIRQAKWNIVKATDLESINAALKSLGLSAIGGDEPAGTLGDVDGSGEINMDDAALLIRYCNNLITLTDEQKAASDLDGNGEINMDDAALLIRYCNNLLEKFPAQN